MGTKTKLAIITIVIVLFTAGILAIRQKVNPIDNKVHKNVNTNTGNEDFDEFNAKFFQAIKNIDEQLEKEMEAKNANSNVNASNFNINQSQENNSEQEIKDKFKDKFLVDYYPKAKISEGIKVLADKQMASAILTTEDDKETVIAYYKDKLGEQVKEIENVKKEADDEVDTSLVLFSAEGGDGELNINIWTQEEVTYINLVISDNFIDPR